MNKNFAKVQLSAEEMRLVRDPAWILTKNSVMGKVIAMFAELSSEIRAGGGKEPKISRGENYKGLPWVMLDYPRVFGKEDVYAIRTFFLWGHAFNVTLHLKGSYRERFLPAILARRAELADAGFEMSISDDEWAHEHNDKTYGPIEERDERPWLKLSARVELELWDEAPEKLFALHNLLMEVLSDDGVR
jgi:hypothetical protein